MISSGIQNVIALVAGMPKIRFEPWPSCQKRVTRPKVAPSERALRASAFNAKTIERNARARRMTEKIAISAKTPTPRPYAT